MPAYDFCQPCRELSGALSITPPHDALKETDRKSLREMTGGRMEGEVVIYRCQACGACFTRDLDLNDPGGRWEHCP